MDGVTTSYVIDIATPLTMVLAETTGTETIYYLHGLDLVAQSDGPSTEYFGYDGLGTVRQMLGSAGSVLFAQVFDPYGNLYASAGTDSTIWGFTGEQTDSNGFIFLRARYYDPGQGHFLQRDPWQRDNGKPMSYNPLSYGFANPVNLIDPAGYYPSGCVLGIDRLTGICPGAPVAGTLGLISLLAVDVPLVIANIGMIFAPGGIVIEILVFVPVDLAVADIHGILASLVAQGATKPCDKIKIRILPPWG